MAKTKREHDEGGIAVAQPPSETQGDTVADQPGIYLVRWGSAPRIKVHTGLSAGPDAEKVAWDLYRNHFDIFRDDLTPDEMTLTEADALTRSAAHGA